MLRLVVLYVRCVAATCLPKKKLVKESECSGESEIEGSRISDKSSLAEPIDPRADEKMCVDSSTSCCSRSRTRNRTNIFLVSNTVPGPRCGPVDS